MRYLYFAIEVRNLLTSLKTIRELTNRRLSRDAAAGSRHSSALPSCRNLNLRFVEDDDVGARGRQIFPPFLKFAFFYSQVSLFVQQKCLNS